MPPRAGRGGSTDTSNPSLVGVFFDWEVLMFITSSKNNSRKILCRIYAFVYHKILPDINKNEAPNVREVT